MALIGAGAGGPPELLQSTTVRGMHQMYQGDTAPRYGKATEADGSER